MGRALEVRGLVEVRGPVEVPRLVEVRGPVAEGQEVRAPRPLEAMYLNWDPLRRP